MGIRPPGRTRIKRRKSSKYLRTILDKKLAASGNILPKASSLYFWNGEIEEATEILLLIKTKSSKVHMLSNYIRLVHPFEIPRLQSSRGPRRRALFKMKPEIREHKTLKMRRLVTDCLHSTDQRTELVQASPSACRALLHEYVKGFPPNICRAEYRRDYLWHMSSEDAEAEEPGQSGAGQNEQSRAQTLLQFPELHDCVH
ncbi:Protein CutA [Manis javanica]|nr:Protein CutA [Manis javanica]